MMIGSLSHEGGTPTDRPARKLEYRVWLLLRKAVVQDRTLTVAFKCHRKIFSSVKAAEARDGTVKQTQQP